MLAATPMAGGPRLLPSPASETGIFADQEKAREKQPEKGKYEMIQAALSETGR